jgi:hypothetical protein
LLVDLLPLFVEGEISVVGDLSVAIRSRESFLLVASCFVGGEVVGVDVGVMISNGN